MLMGKQKAAVNFNTAERYLEVLAAAFPEGYRYIIIYRRRKLEVLETGTLEPSVGLGIIQAEEEKS